MTDAPLSFDGFLNRLDRQLAWPCGIEGHAPSTDLYADLGLDSIQAFEVLLATEELAGLDEPPPELPALRTLDDVFEYFQRAILLERSGG